MQDNSKVSGCFITYNEEKSIKKFIENIKPLVDEIIIVDGLSTDNTVKIAQELGATVYQRKFDDYASQRNYALTKAKYDWRFVLDLDETISPEFAKLLPKLIKSRKADCFKVKIYHYRTDDKKLMTVGWKRVLFRNYGIYWGELHERAISFKLEKKIFDKNVFVTEYKSAQERLANYLKYKKMLISMYKKYEKNGQVLLMNKVRYYLMPDHNKQMLTEIDDPAFKREAYIDIPSVTK